MPQGFPLGSVEPLLLGLRGHRGTWRNRWKKRELLKHDVAMLEKQLKKMRARLKELEEKQQEDEE